MGDDFFVYGPSYFNFAIGPGNRSCITVNITNDDDYEGDELFVISLSNSPPMVKRSVDDPVRAKRTGNYFSDPDGPVIGSPSSTTVTIRDPEGNMNLLITASV